MRTTTFRDRKRSGKPLFSELDTGRTLAISGDHSVVGRIEQRITWERPISGVIRHNLEVR
jgi:hypothetical protein